MKIHNLNGNICGSKVHVCFFHYTMLSHYEQINAEWCKLKAKRKKINVIWKPLRLVLGVKTNKIYNQSNTRIQVRLVTEHKESETQTKNENYSLLQ